MKRPTFEAIRGLGPDGVVYLPGSTIPVNVRETVVDVNYREKMALWLVGYSHTSLDLRTLAQVAIWWGEMGGDVGWSHAFLVATDGRGVLWSEPKGFVEADLRTEPV